MSRNGQKEQRFLGRRKYDHRCKNYSPTTYFPNTKLAQTRPDNFLRKQTTIKAKLLEA